MRTINKLRKEKLLSVCDVCKPRVNVNLKCLSCGGATQTKKNNNIASAIKCLTLWEFSQRKLISVYIEKMYRTYKKYTSEPLIRKRAE